jgi:hypothetical protein
VTSSTPPLVSSWILAQIPFSTHCRYTPSRRVDIAGLAAGLKCEGWTVIAVNMSPDSPLTSLDPSLSYCRGEGWAELSWRGDCLGGKTARDWGKTAHDWTQHGMQIPPSIPSWPPTLCSQNPLLIRRVGTRVIMGERRKDNWQLVGLARPNSKQIFLWRVHSTNSRAPDNRELGSIWQLRISKAG